MACLEGQTLKDKIADALLCHTWVKDALPRRCGDGFSRNFPLLAFVHSCPPPALAAGISPLSIEPAFEQNLGEAPGDVLFLARGRGRTVHLTAGAMIFTREADEGPAEMVTMRWVNGSAESAANGVSPLELRTSYYVGTDPADWLPDVPSYSKVR